MHVHEAAADADVREILHACVYMSQCEPNELKKAERSTLQRARIFGASLALRLGTETMLRPAPSACHATAE